MIITTTHRIPRYMKRLLGSDITNFEDLSNKVSISYLCNILTEAVNLSAEHYLDDETIQIVIDVDKVPTPMTISYNQLARLIAEQIPWDVLTATNNKDAVNIDSVFKQ